MDKLKQAVVLVTGAAEGIGKASADQLVKNGATVIYSDQNLDSLKMNSWESGSDFLKLDVTSHDDWQTAATYIEDKYGRLDILVNNAGITGAISNGEQSPETFSESEWDVVFSVNVKGILLGIKHLSHLLGKSNNASIVNISSAVTARAAPNALAYSASKAAVESITRSVAIYYANEDKQIRCNCIRPGATLTSMWGANLTKEDISLISKNNPMKRMSSPDEIANLVYFLASNDSNYINGEAISIDGGYSVK